MNAARRIMKKSKSITGEHWRNSTVNSRKRRTGKLQIDSLREIAGWAPD